MRCTVSAIFFIAIIFSCQKKTNEPAPTSPKFELVWADEFNYSGPPDASRWSFENGFVRNNEAQFYTNLPENAFVQNGVLTIKATHDNSRTNPITSASIITKGKKDFLYGRLEIKAKMPTGKGAWPAFWTAGVNRDLVGWPACGEIDIVEWLGYLPNFIFGSLHKANAQNKDAPLLGPYSPSNSNFSNEFHVYAIEWDESSIRFFFDDYNYITYTAAQMTPAEWAQFTKPHFILINLAVGGNSGGTIDYAKFPFVYEVDYVRYFVKK